MDDAISARQVSVMSESEVRDPDADMPGLEGTGERWRRLAAVSSVELRHRLGRYIQLTDKDRERLARRLRRAIDAALEVPEDLPDRIERRVTRLRAGAGPDADVVQLAWTRTRQRARRTAAIGAVTTVPAMVPGLGPALAAVGLVADWRFVAEQQRDLVLEIGALMGVRLERPTEQVRALFMASAVSAFGASAAGEAVVEALAGQIARRSLGRIVPGAGATVAGALNYVATVALGRAAIAWFAERAGLEIEGAIPRRVHPAMPWLRNAIVRALPGPLEPGAYTGVFTDAELAIIQELPRVAREELLDLAATALAAGGAAMAERTHVFEEIAAALGFSPAERDAAVRNAARDIRTVAFRVGKLLGRARNAGARASTGLWRRAARLARPRRGARRSPADPKRESGGSDHARPPAP